MSDRLNPGAVSFFSGGESPKSPTKMSTPTAKMSEATFTARSFPDIHHQAYVVGLCTYERAGYDDLGYHVADFLAYKTLISPHVAQGAQKWLSLCDIQDVVKKSGQEYTHGSTDRRVVTRGAFDLPDLEEGEISEGYVEIEVESSALKLATRVVLAIRDLALRAKEMGSQLIILICGPSTLEQDIFFGESVYRACVTSEQIRVAASGAKTTIITPSSTSPGWLVTTSSSASPDFDFKLVDAAAGGTFSTYIIDDVFLEGQSPLIDQALVDPKDAMGTPGPVRLTAQQQKAREDLRDKIHSLLTSRMLPGNSDHAFSFDPKLDDWPLRRRGRGLEELGREWQRLEATADSVSKDEEQLSFLGGAFGGNRKSQTSHIKHMLKESMASFPGYHTDSFGKEIVEKFDKFIAEEKPDELDCHTMFNIMEHRLSMAALSDIVLKDLGIEPSFGQRCRDWDCNKWNRTASDTTKMVQSQAMKALYQVFPWANVPVGRNINTQNKLHRLFRVPLCFLGASLALRHQVIGVEFQADVDRLTQRLHQVRTSQVAMLTDNPDIRDMGKAWLASIGVPARDFDLEDIKAAGLLGLAPTINPKTNNELPVTAVEVDIDFDKQQTSGGPSVSDKQLGRHKAATDDEGGNEQPISTEAVAINKSWDGPQGSIEAVTTGNGWSQKPSDDETTLVGNSWGETVAADNVRAKQPDPKETTPLVNTAAPAAVFEVPVSPVNNNKVESSSTASPAANGWGETVAGDNIRAKQPDRTETTPLVNTAAPTPLLENNKVQSSSVASSAGYGWGETVAGDNVRAKQPDREYTTPPVNTAAAPEVLVPPVENKKVQSSSIVADTDRSIPPHMRKPKGVKREIPTYVW